MTDISGEKTAPCPVCRGADTTFLFDLPDAPVIRCRGCGFLFLDPQPSDEVLRRIYDETYSLFGASDARMLAHVAVLKTATANLYLEQLAKEGIRGGRLLEVGCGDGYFLQAAEQAGFEVVGVEYSEHAAQRAQARLKRGKVLVGELTTAALSSATFDVCVLADVIEHVRDPRAFLQTAGQCLKPGGCLFIATPDTDSWSARLMGRNWMEYKMEHISYFSRRTLRSLLEQTGFHAVRIQAGYKTVSLHYVKAHFESYPVPLWTTLVRICVGWIPRRWRESPRRLTGSGMLALATRNPAGPS